MRNPLKRRPRDEAKPTLRERLSATKEKYARTLAMHRAMNPPPAAPAVDRVALVTYASWLFMERRMVCRELYPHMGHRATSFVLSAEAADRFHYPTTGQMVKGEPAAWKASARAVQVLDMVGVDWRADLADRHNLDGPEMQDTGDRPAVPYGWPRADTPLLDALDDLNRLDAAQSAMGKVGPAERNADTVPGYEGLEDARNDALTRLGKFRADTLVGLQAKAKALLTRSVSDMGGEDHQEIADSLARDLLGATNRSLEPRPDPIFDAIKECRRLEAAHAAIHDVCSGMPDGDPSWEGQSEAHAAYWTQWRDVVLKTVPRTAEGCRTLAVYALSFSAEQGKDADDAEAVLALIARSPLL